MVMIHPPCPNASERMIRINGSTFGRMIDAGWRMDEAMRTMVAPGVKSAGTTGSEASKPGAATSGANGRRR